MIYSDNEDNSLTASPGDLVMANPHGISMSDSIFANTRTFKMDRFADIGAEKEMSMSNKIRTSPLGVFGGGAHAVCVHFFVDCAQY